MPILGRPTMKSLLCMSAITLITANSMVEDHRSLSGPTSCGRDSSFQAYALVEHEMMVDPYVIDSEELRLLSAGFTQQYNTVNAPAGGKNDACDVTHLRYADKTTIEPKDVFYEDLPEGGYPARRNFLYRFRISGVNVTSETSMFEWELDAASNETDRRNLFQVPDAILNSARSKVCQCSPNITEKRAPTEEEFTHLFNRFIKKQTNNERLTNVGRAIHVTELEVVECSPEYIEYDAELVLEIGGSAVRQGEEVDKKELGSDLMDAYNDLSGNFCDPCVHSILSVIVEDMEEEETEGRELRKSTRTTMRSKLRLMCRRDPENCNPKKRKMFNVDVGGLFRRRLAPLVPVSAPSERYRRRRVESDNVCFCPTQPEGNRPPTAEEFQRVYNSITKKTSAHTVSVKEVSQ